MGEGKGEFGFLRDCGRDRRWTRTFVHWRAHPQFPPQVIWDRSVQDRYRDPGTPLLKTLPTGHQVIQRHGAGIYLAGEGASSLGEHPFLDYLSLISLEKLPLFQSEPK